MRRGRKPIPSRMKLVRGTFRRDRARAAVVAPVAPGTVADPPAWLSAFGRRLWAFHVATYQRRGQVIAGCEPLLAVYCQVEAELARRGRKGLEVPASLVTAYRQLAAEFFDTPASQIGRVATPAPENRFAKHARPPSDR